VIDPTFELLWKKVGEAYRQVAANRDRTIEFEHDKYRVVIHDTGEGGIVAQIWDDGQPTEPKLIAP
jgi:hypothetical protein